MSAEVSSGPLWNPQARKWENRLVELPVADGRRLLLVPKALVRIKMDYDAGEYYRHFLLEYLSEKEMDAKTELVHLLKDGTPRVLKKNLVKKYGEGKSAIVRLTQEYPEVLEWYRASKSHHVQPPMDHITMAEVTGTNPPDWDSLIASVAAIDPGAPGADDYHDKVEALLSTVLYPQLANPAKEFRIHGGRKRIDITYVNLAQAGFFGWLKDHYPAAHIFVECKNYTRDIVNPELDQLAGRFSPSRGRFGLLVCRGFENKGLFIQRCRDTAHDDRGFIIVLDDDDLRTLVRLAKDDDRQAQFEFLKARFDELIM